jgi:hypothetical protein
MNDYSRRRGGRRTVVARIIDPKAGVAGLLSAVVVSSLIFLGSNNLRHFDWVLLPYAAATVCSAVAIAYRYTIWLQRPPTKRYWQQGWRLLLRNKPLQNSGYLVRLLLDNFAAQRFIAQRGHLRWVMHLCLSWGGMLAFALTFPLVFGWMHFETPATDLHVYQLFILGVKVQEFSVDSLIAFLSFNAPPARLEPSQHVTRRRGPRATGPHRDIPLAAAARRGPPTPDP